METHMTQAGGHETGEGGVQFRSRVEGGEPDYEFIIRGR